MKQGLTIAAGLVVAGALLVGIAGFGTPAAAQQSPPGDIGGMANMTGGANMRAMMQMMQATSSPEHQAICTKFMNSAAGRQMMQGMGGTGVGSGSR